MSKAVLIVICDFLLLSLLALARFDSPQQQVAQEQPEAPPKPPENPGSEMLDVLKLTLEEERAAREKLAEQLTKAEQTLEARDETLAEREARIRQAQEALARKEQETRKVSDERAALEQKLAAKETNLEAMQQQFTATRSNLAALERQYSVAAENLESLQSQYATARDDAAALKQELAATSSEARISQRVLAELQDDLRRKVEESAALQAQMQELARSREAAEAEKQRLANQLQVTETEKRLTTQQLESLRGEYTAVREEKAKLQTQTAKLHEDVTVLAESSEKIAQTSEKLTEELVKQRPLAANTIFNEFATNRVLTSFEAARPGIFGQTARKEQTAKTIIVSYDGQLYAIYHIEDTPLSLSALPPDWESMTGILSRGSSLFGIGQLRFLDRDPRIVVVPIGDTQARALGCKIYPVAKEPFRFQEAVLVGATEGYYGECQFQIDSETPNYVRMYRERFSRLSGKFLPSRGDLVFSKTGELIGVMANKEYCVLINDFKSSRELRLGKNLAAQNPQSLLTQMYYQITGLPSRLQ